MERPRVIFLDAVGTLFGIQGSVGAIYSQLARQFGVEVSEADLNLAFGQSFRRSEPAAFPNVEPSEIPVLEFEWWQAIAQETFAQAGVLQQFSDFATFFKELYAYFETPSPWFVYPEVPLILEEWRSQEIELGILSNFDSRLYSVLGALGLAKFFTSITISTEVGAAKPSPAIFAAGLEKHHCDAIAAWHIGDSYQEDYEAAQAVGLQGIWLNRSDKSVPIRSYPSPSPAMLTPAPQPRSIRNLSELSELITQ
ncbi:MULTISPECIES: HAD-IA family hydrolase [Trichocoleus]|uniref:HAD-IA family hydrolase n=1 Tax=Trichocoleus desertorum GB2-A4 TaxID=2933944 RepID=A0ABV0J2X5_9CYAN|nr:HAD-IA family hydrolase [Trichocoleus sp. FACHB-46]MBD1860750.1 HAD-IA family hydrolase [Trichocoleus sp. FACHB-46]